MKKFKLLLPLMILLFVSLNVQNSYGQRQAKRTRARTSQKSIAHKTNAPSMTTIINNIEEIYDKFPFTNLSDDECQKMRESISKYFNALPPAVEKTKIITYYYNAIVDASEEESNEALLRNGIIYISLGDTTEIESAFGALAIYYANAYDKDNLSHVLDDFQTYSLNHNNKYESIIEQMQKDYYEILTPFMEKAKGTWVMVNKTDKMNPTHFPYSIITINDLQSNTGICMSNYPGCDNTVFSESLSTLSCSQAIGGHNGYITALFASGHLDIGDDSFAKSGFEMTRQFRANVNGEIAASNAKFGDKMAASLAAGITSSLLDALFESTAQSYHRTAAMNLQLNYVSSNLLQGNMQYWDYTYNVNQMNHGTPPPNYDDKVDYVKWEPKDSVYFVNSKCNVFSVSPMNELDLSEYNRIKNNFSWTNPKYLLPLIGTEAIGAAMTFYGVSQIANCRVKDSFGNSIMQSDGSYKVNKGKEIRGIVLSITGLLMMIDSPLIIWGVRSAKRSKAFRKLNDDNLEKLRNKTSSTLSIAPFVETDNSFGLNAGIHF